jgi:hypothetical protein
MPISTPYLTRGLAASVLCIAVLTGCRSKSAASDTGDGALTHQLQTKLAGDPSIAGQPVQASVQSGVATLSGSVGNDAQRELAARDAEGIDGIKEVLNNLTVQGGSPGSAPPATTSVAPPSPVQPANPRSVARVEPPPPQPQTAPVEREQPPSQPSFRNLTIPAGTVLPVRITQTLDSASTQPGDRFTGAIAGDIIVDGLVAIPQGASVTGSVDAVQEAAHFKGSSLLTVSLASLDRRGERIALSTDPYSVKGKGRGESTAVKTGIGAGAGAILGGIFGGGKGAAIGAAAGGGLGAGSSAVTRGQQVQIPSESLVRFNLTSPIVVRVQTGGPRDERPSGEPRLQPRPQS